MESNKVRYNFGASGWKIIGFEVVLLFFMTGLTVDGLNIIVPSMAAFRGWNPDTLLSISSPAGIIALFIVVFWGKFIDKWGLKKVTVVTMLLAAVSTIAFGNSVSIGMYAASLVCMVAFINAFAITCGFAICANWFPTQKGIVMGFVTIGMNLASAVINLILNALAQRFDIAMALTIMGCAIAVVALLVALFVKATPEEAGCYPDNDPKVAELIHREEKMLGESRKSYKEALKDPKVWILGLGYGFFGLAIVGIMSQLVGFFVEVKGYGLQDAIFMITIAAIIGMVGSWLWGVVDQKIGTQTASVLFGLWYAIGIICLISGIEILLYVGVFMVGFAIGGNGNFAPSMASFAFGRRDFPVCFSCMNMVLGVTRSCSFVVLAVLRSMTAGYTVPYIVFACISVLGAVLIASVKITGAVGHLGGTEEGENE